jgi:hypothetical protein
VSAVGVRESEYVPGLISIGHSEDPLGIEKYILLDAGGNLTVAATCPWMPLLLLAIFFYAVDVHGIDKQKAAKEKLMSEELITYGVLGEYVVDEAPSFGLFIRLNERPVFVDIRSDSKIELRKIRAKYLYEHQEELTEELRKFIASNPSFESRRPQSIGLHAEDVEQGEVFWNPDGYTSLKGLIFTA